MPVTVTTLFDRFLSWSCGALIIKIRIYIKLRRWLWGNISTTGCGLLPLNYLSALWHLHACVLRVSISIPRIPAFSLLPFLFPTSPFKTGYICAGQSIGTLCERGGSMMTSPALSCLLGKCYPFSSTYHHHHFISIKKRTYYCILKFFIW